MRHAAFLAAGTLALTATQTVAMPHCEDRDVVVEKLMGEYSEQHFASGLQSDTGLMEIWASDRDGSWTILLTRPDGQTCVMATGTHWLTQELMAEAFGEPA